MGMKDSGLFGAEFFDQPRQPRYKGMPMLHTWYRTQPNIETFCSLKQWRQTGFRMMK
jgi:hypothetical protein